MTIKEFNEKLKEMLNQVMDEEKCCISRISVRYARTMGGKPLILDIESMTETFN